MMQNEVKVLYEKGGNNDLFYIGAYPLSTLRVYDKLQLFVLGVEDIVKIKPWN